MAELLRPGFGWCVLLAVVPAFIACRMGFVWVFNPQTKTVPIKTILPVGDGSISIARLTHQGIDEWSWGGGASLASGDYPEDESYDYYQQQDHDNEYLHGRRTLPSRHRAFVPTLY